MDNKNRTRNKYCINEKHMLRPYKIYTNDMHYIYMITNLINNKKYVGQVQQKDLRARWLNHCHNKNQLVYNAIKKYGRYNFKYEILEIWHSQQETDDAEEFLIKYHNSHVSFGKGYNIDYGGKVNKRSKETREKISKLAKGRYAGNKNPMFGIKMIGEENHFYGKKHSIESKIKISTSKRKLTDLEIKNILNDKRSSQKISKDYNVSSVTILNIKKYYVVDSLTGNIKREYK